MTLLVTTLLVGAVSANNPLELRGIGLHQETGRDIYLGGLYSRQGQPDTAEALLSSPPWSMEYRIVARRTSIRSLLGGMLLQSEIAAGHSPDDAISKFADTILAAVKTSLYAGDVLEIRLEQPAASVALLNGQELARSPDSAAASYLLLGWINEKGASTAFRENLTRATPDPALLAEFQATHYSGERRAQVSSWLSPPGNSTRLDNAMRQAAVTTKAADGTAMQEPTETAMPQSAPAMSLFPVSGTADTPTLPAPGNTDHLQPTQVASLTTTAASLPQPNPLAEVMALDLQEYSERLSRFHGGLVTSVYKYIRYPTRAVRRSLEGRLELDITLDESGELIDITVSRTSGHRLLDNAATDAAERAMDKGGAITIDPVAMAEFGNGEGQVVVPVPVSFTLAE